MVTAAAAQDQPRLQALLCLVARSELHPPIVTAVQALAAGFAAHNLPLAAMLAAAGRAPGGPGLRLAS